jgi:hypothetical protein
LAGRAVEAGKGTAVLMIGRRPQPLVWCVASCAFPCARTSRHRATKRRGGYSFVRRRKGLAKQGDLAFVFQTPRPMKLLC